MTAQGKNCSPLTAEDTGYARSYRIFKQFLKQNYTALEAMADLEQAHQGGRTQPVTDIHETLGRLLHAVKAMIENMQALGSKDYAPLLRVVERVSRESLDQLQPVVEHRKEFVLPLDCVTREMVTFVGAKAANLGLISTDLELPTPSGFVVTAEGFRAFLRQNHLHETITRELQDLTAESSSQEIFQVSEKLGQLILDTPLPDSLAAPMHEAFDALLEKTDLESGVAVRSSAVGEDGEISFAGQYASVLGVDKAGLFHAYRRVLASKYSPRAISYRMHHNLSDEETPMGVLVISMVPAQVSGVVYSMDPSGNSSSKTLRNASTEHGPDHAQETDERGDPDVLMISAVWGLGESLVSGEQSPDVYLVRKGDLAIVDREIPRKAKQLVLLPKGGTTLEDVPENLQAIQALSDANIGMLTRYAVRLEEFFQSPQDIEWCLDQKENVLLLQSRPLHIRSGGQSRRSVVDTTRHPLLIRQGKTASVGVATGRAFVLENPSQVEAIPDNAILVTRTTAPEYARHMHRVRGLITDMGGVSSHLASVAREYGVPAIVDAGEAMQRIAHDQEVTMDAGTTTVYQGRVKEWLDGVGPAGKPSAMHGPMHRRLGDILRNISPLNLTDPQDPSFSAKNCHTIHDVIRFLHEQSMTEMFHLAGTGDQHQAGAGAVKLESDIPLRIRLLDLGGGLREGLTSCDVVTFDDLRCIPLRALWQGLNHPGLNWSSAVELSWRNMAGLMTFGAMGQVATDNAAMQGSFALVAGDYLNLNAKFGFHYANLDVLCPEQGDQTHVLFQFSGGAGSYFGKSLRILLLAEILQKLEFSTQLKGDFISASLKGYAAEAVRGKLDQLGRLLGCSRLLDVALHDESDVRRLTDMFFAGEYDFLQRQRSEALRDFYIRDGHWNSTLENNEPICRQEGTRVVDPVSAGLACLLGRVMGSGYHSFLESIKAYAYFPLAIAKESFFDQGRLEVSVRCESGCIDMAAGLVFGLRNAGNYFVFRLDALKHNAVLLRFVKGEVTELARTEWRCSTDHWYRLGVDTDGHELRASVDGQIVLKKALDESCQGYCGLWSKADSVVSFKDMRLFVADGERRWSFK